ncbi:molybdenum cofactor biosynthesis protein A [Niallia circulans]|uniref:GTP 3',8-cyclase MoaA n=1 Tax=Niallia circulans TaxID=1397 RepID=UPI00077C36D5|nr:GTP 3',8-cyclase MoaA [Niallia circulans]MDR4316052.1 GTP 3',8-cyclase MoaA [Niallia circulans]MED3837609.1 GTP 3',8-cyclase MoaA [Niallia circulans]MED4244679.1 GTP 3',8-cyclase MoaA [Niallia circulans]MED4249837.1 GTP 3',8-cyclase MoaA [Niallia circulans]QKH60507.1 GTP 3',8-cyclase MoaA [Niallia circulans]
MKDLLNRPLRDLRISVIDRCNLRCQYCMPKEIFGPDYPFLPPSELLTYDEIERIAKIFVELGVEKIRLTGGEPLLRKDLPVLVDRLIRLEGLEDIALTTNGIFLPKYAHDLKEAGLKRVNISLDSINDELFGQMNGRNVGAAPVKKGIEAAQNAGLGIKINMVIKKGMNDSEIIPMATYCKENELELRFIEYMDVGSTNGWKMKDVITKKEIYAKLQESFELEPVEADYFGEVAKKYKYKDANVLVGFITSVSESFCSSCTRARLSANGQLYTCLFNGNGHNIRDFLREGADDSALEGFIKNIWEQRRDRYSDERTEETVKQRKKVEMSYIGG